MSATSPIGQPSPPQSPRDKSISTDGKTPVNGAKSVPPSEMQTKPVKALKSYSVSTPEIMAQVDTQENKKILEFIEKINTDPKGEIKEKNKNGFPQIANELIDLGYYLRDEVKGAIDPKTKAALNNLVSKLLKEQHFLTGGEKGKLWAVHVDAVWLAHEMEKKGILDENTKKTILEISQARIDQTENKLLRGNFNAIQNLWKFGEIMVPEKQRIQFAKIAAENEKLRDQLQRLEQELSQLLGEYKDVGRDNEELTSRFKDQLQKKEELNQALTKEKQDYQQAAKDLEQKNRELEKQIQKLTDGFDNLHKEYQGKYNAYLKEQNNLTSNLQQKEQELSTFKTQVDSLNSQIQSVKDREDSVTKAIQQQQDTISELTNTNNELRTQNQNTQKFLGQAKKTSEKQKNTIDTLEKQTKALQEQLEEAQTEKEKLTENLKSSNQELSNQQKGNESQKEQNQKLQSQINNLKNIYEQTEKTLKQQNESLEQNSKNLSTQNNELQQQINQSKEHQKILTQNKKEIEDSNKQLINEKAQLQQKLNQLEQQKRQLQTKTEESEQKNKQQGQELIELQKKNKEISSTSQAKDKRIRELEAQLSNAIEGNRLKEIREKIQDIKSQKKQYLEKINQTISNWEKLIQENNALRKQLNNLPQNTNLLQNLEDLKRILVDIQNLQISDMETDFSKLNLLSENLKGLNNQAVKINGNYQKFSEENYNLQKDLQKEIDIKSLQSFNQEQDLLKGNISQLKQFIKDAQIALKLNKDLSPQNKENQTTLEALIKKIEIRIIQVEASIKSIAQRQDDIKLQLIGLNNIKQFNKEAEEFLTQGKVLKDGIEQMNKNYEEEFKNLKEEYQNIARDVLANLSVLNKLLNNSEDNIKEKLMSINNTYWNRAQAIMDRYTKYEENNGMSITVSNQKELVANCKSDLVALQNLIQEVDTNIRKIEAERIRQDQTKVMENEGLKQNIQREFNSIEQLIIQSKENIDKLLIQRNSLIQSGKIEVKEDFQNKYKDILIRETEIKHNFNKLIQEGNLQEINDLNLLKNLQIIQKELFELNLKIEGEVNEPIERDKEKIGDFREILITLSKTDQYLEDTVGKVLTEQTRKQMRDKYAKNMDIDSHKENLLWYVNNSDGLDTDLFKIKNIVANSTKQTAEADIEMIENISNQAIKIVNQLKYFNLKTSAERAALAKRIKDRSSESQNSINEKAGISLFKKTRKTPK